MKIAASILDCKDRIKGVMDLNRTNVSYIHIDVMDGKFVPNVQFENIGEISGINRVNKYPMDVHLMVDNPIEYIKKLGDLNIEYITIHLEINKDKKEIFKSIRELGYKVGLSIKPNTSISEIEPYLSDIDLVLVMSVEPGVGGQKFIEETVAKVRALKELIKKSGRDILIEVDGGINDEVITQLNNVDIAVVGSYITKSDNYYKSVENLLKVNALEKDEIVRKNSHYNDAEEVTDAKEKFNVTNEIEKINYYIIFIILNIILFGISSLLIYKNLWIGVAVILLIFVTISNIVLIFDVGRVGGRKFNFIKDDKVNNIKLLISKYIMLACFGFGEFLLFLFLEYYLFFVVGPRYSLAFIFMVIFFGIQALLVLGSFVIHGILVVVVSSINLAKLKKHLQVKMM